MLFKRTNFRQYVDCLCERILNCCNVCQVKVEVRDRITSGYLRGTTYLQTPFFGMIAVVTLFVKRCGGCQKTCSTEGVENDASARSPNLILFRRRVAVTFDPDPKSWRSPCLLNHAYQFAAAASYRHRLSENNITFKRHLKTHLFKLT